jgi:hypothetical protein
MAHRTWRVLGRLISGDGSFGHDLSGTPDPNPARIGATSSRSRPRGRAGTFTSYRDVGPAFVQRDERSSIVGQLSVVRGQLSVGNNDGPPRQVNRAHDPVAVTTAVLIFQAPNRKRMPGRDIRR